ncbi:MAG: TlyA family RNA methyltransferase [Coriobacteriales bacterium]|nr:TlyA family RNA methyltransferase [Coriobacteriales bacterium]
MPSSQPQRRGAPKRRRLDEELVAQGFFANPADAMRAVMAGEVSTTNRRMERPGEQVRPGITLHVRGHERYVSRGGLKLEHGLAAFGLDVSGLLCLDVGCSTGGFTDCLLRHGAACVHAVDVGYAQFDWSLRQDPRVTLLERTNIVDVPAIVGPLRFDVAVCDVSFTSVLTILPAVCELLAPGGYFLTLVKPQFEAPRGSVDDCGVVREEHVRMGALQCVREGMEQRGFAIEGWCESPIRGRKGNVEYLLLGHLTS